MISKYYSHDLLVLQLDLIMDAINSICHRAYIVHSEIAHVARFDFHVQIYASKHSCGMLEYLPILILVGSISMSFVYEA